MATATASFSSLDIDGMLRVKGVPQWRLAHAEDLSTHTAVGWDNTNPDIVTECAGILMLGGFGKFAKGEVSKKIIDLPAHNQLRIKAIFHFIDAWSGETAFMRANVGKDGAGTSEGKFAVPIDITLPHALDSIVIGFGSTMENDDPMDASWGVSGIEIYVRG